MRQNNLKWQNKQTIYKTFKTFGLGWIRTIDNIKTLA